MPVPLGYVEMDDGWIEKDPDEIQLVKDIFNVFCECESYAETERRIEGKYGSVFEGHTLKHLIQNEVYIGKPQLSGDVPRDYAGKTVLDEPPLQIISEETFNEAQQIVKEINKKYASTDPTEVEDVMAEFDVFSVVESSPPVKLVCEDCGTELEKNGRRSLPNAPIGSHMYECPECETERKWPRESEYNNMKILHKLPDLQFLREKLGI